MTPLIVSHSLCCNSAWRFSIYHISNHCVWIKSQWRCTLDPRVQNMGLMEWMCLWENPLWFCICRQHYCTCEYPSICACNLVDIMRSDFSYLAPLVSCQLLWFNYALTWEQQAIPTEWTSLGCEKCHWKKLRKWTENFDYHSSSCRKIHWVMEQPKKDGEQYCLDIWMVTKSNWNF